MNKSRWGLGFALFACVYALAAHGEAQGFVFVQSAAQPNGVSGFSLAPGASTLAPLPALTNILDGFPSESRWVAADIDGDHKPEIVTLLNGHVAGFAFDPVAQTYTAFEGPDLGTLTDGRLFAGDIDGDGNEEILIGHFGSDGPAPRPATGGSTDVDIIDFSKAGNTFSFKWSLLTGQFVTGFTQFALSDVNHDGRGDLLILTQDTRDSGNVALGATNQFGEPTGPTTLFGCTLDLSGPDAACNPLFTTSIAPSASGKAPLSIAPLSIAGLLNTEIFLGFGTCCDQNDPGAVKCVFFDGTIHDCGGGTLGTFQRLVSGRPAGGTSDQLIGTFGGIQGNGTVQVQSVAASGALTTVASASAAFPAPAHGEPGANLSVVNSAGACNDQDQSDCLVNILEVPICWTGTQAEFEQAVEAQRDELVKAAGLDACTDRVHFVTAAAPAGGQLASLCTTCGNSDATLCSSCILGDVRKAITADGIFTADQLGQFALVGGLTQLSKCEPIEGQSNGKDTIWAAIQTSPLNQHDLALGLEEQPTVTTAHEWGHTRGLFEEYCSKAEGAIANSRCSEPAPNDPDPLSAALNCDETQTSCCSSDYRDLDGPAQTDPTKPCSGGEGPLRCCRGNQNRDGGRCVMSHATATGPRTFCDECRTQLVKTGISCAQHGDTRQKMFGGSVNVDDQGNFFLIGTYQALAQTSFPLNVGDHSVVFTNNAGTVLATRRFSFSDSIADYAPAGIVMHSAVVGFGFPLPPEVAAGNPVRIAIDQGSVELTHGTLNGRPPVANAGADRTFECDRPQAGSITLDGTASSDPDGDSLSYLWSSATIQLAAPHAALTAGVAPLGSSVATLQVQDGILTSALDTVTVRVVDTTPPVLSGASSVTRVVCSDSESISLPIPSATDVCSPTVSVTGKVISSNGVTLPSPLLISGGNATLPPGQHVVVWTARDASGNQSTLTQTVLIGSSLEASSALLLGDRSQVLAQSGGNAVIANYGSSQTQLGVQAVSGSISSVASVTLKDRARVNGNVRTTGVITPGNATTIAGSQSTHVPVNLPALPALTWAGGTSSTPVTVPLNAHASLSPGTFGAVLVNAGATLTLAPGEYWFDTLDLEPHAGLALAAATTVNVHNHLIYRGNVQSTSGAILTLLYHGAADAIIEAPLAAQMLAPSAHVIVRAAYTGRLGARTLELDADVTVTCSGSPNATPPVSSAFSCGVARAPASSGGFTLVGSLLGVSLALARRRRVKLRQRACRPS